MAVFPASKIQTLFSTAPIVKIGKLSVKATTLGQSRKKPRLFALFRHFGPNAEPKSAQSNQTQSLIGPELPPNLPPGHSPVSASPTSFGGLHRGR